MFKIVQQSVSKNRLGVSYETVQSVTVETFNEDLAEKAMSSSKAKGYTCRMYISKEDKVPLGYASKELQYSVAIWKPNVVSLDMALSMFE